MEVPENVSCFRDFFSPQTKLVLDSAPRGFISRGAFVLRMGMLRPCMIFDMKPDVLRTLSKNTKPNWLGLVLPAGRADCLVSAHALWRSSQLYSALPAQCVELGL